MNLTKEIMELTERITNFTNEVYQLYGKNPVSMDFIEYWTESSPGSKKCRYEFEKVFNIKRRFKTWQRNQKIWYNRTPNFTEQAINLTNDAQDLFNDWDKKQIG